MSLTLIPLEDQLYAFVITIIVGVLAGLLFDLYRVLTQLFKFKKWGLVLGDISYWLILTPVVFIILLWGNRGEVRFYVLIGLAIGALLYLRLFSQRATPIIKAIIKLINQCVSLIINVFIVIWTATCLPFKVIFIVITVPLGFIFKLLEKLKVGIKNVLVKLNRK